MRSIEDLVRFESECAYLDFKVKQYVPEKHTDLLKDVIAFANAPIDGDKFIIFGVNAPANTERTFVGIERSDFIDPAVWQQLVSENIEPAVQIEYTRHPIDGVELGILRILAPKDPPYMMKKDFGQNLRRGDAFIRKGAFQTRAVRTDFDRMAEWKSSQHPIHDSIELLVGFDKEAKSDLLELKTLDEKYELPSEEAEREIVAAIKQREAEAPSGLILRPIYALEWVPYAKRPLDELRRNLANLGDAYLKHDLHQAFEVDGERLNFWLLNSGKKYIEDVSVSLEFPFEGISYDVAQEIYSEPPRGGLFHIPQVRVAPIGYPEVEKGKSSFLARAHIGNLKHHLPVQAFQQDLRIFARNNCRGKEIALVCTIFGKNLAAPIKYPLRLRFV